jgi:RNA polymerase subunit RPABC4/transcription elongation factor Spt4
MIRERSGYLIRCDGYLPDGRRCRNHVVLLPDEKTTCPCCGVVHVSWSDHLAITTKGENATALRAS